MKAGIVTLYGPMPNFGNKLQNYAVKKVLEKIGLQSQTIVMQPLGNLLKEAVKYTLARLGVVRFKYMLKIEKILMKKLKFNRFNKKYLNPSFDLLRGKLRTEKFDYFVLGSDQVWNANWFNEAREEACLLKFCEDDQKITFSPSFGTSHIPEKYREDFSTYLSKIPYISVREEEGVKLVKELTGKDATLLIDPTLMLDKEEWLSIARKPRKVDITKPYIFAYFLGEISDNAAKQMKYFAESNGFWVYDIMNETDCDKYACGPDEFLYLISNASLVMTDSFHACVFSFLFSRPFLVFDRQSEINMQNRITTLLKKFDIERKYANSGLDNDVFECDYSVGFERLIEEREKVIEFLKMSMHLK